MAHAVLLAGLGYGDEGKGSIVDYLCQTTGSQLVVRYNGGAQAAHNVVTDDGRHHTFAQFGSGTFAGAQTLLSRHVLVNPISLMHEGRGLVANGVANPFEGMHVERDALVTTPFHVSANRIRECVRTGRHGSCGMGIGETMQDFVEKRESLFIRDLVGDRAALRKKLKSIQERKRDEMHSLAVTELNRRLFHTPRIVAGRPVPLGLREKYAGVNEWQTFEGDEYIERALDFYAAFVDQVKIVGPEFLDERLKTDERIVFEGAQGVLLDQDFGFQPHTTWTDITFTNALQLIGGNTETTRLGVLRAYQTRHGAGPFVSENKLFDPCSAEDHNRTGDWQGVFRSGAFDFVTARYAMQVIGRLDGLVINHVDRVQREFPGKVPVCVAYKVTGSLEVDALHVHRPFDLLYQNYLTRTLSEAQPVYERFVADRLPHTIAETLNCPIAIAGTGPSARGKQFFPLGVRSPV